MIRMYICTCCGYVCRSAGAAHQRTYTCAVFFSSENDTHSMTVPQMKGRLDAGYLMGACFTSSMHSEKQHVFLQASCKQKMLTYPSICRQMTWTDRAGAQFFFRWKMMHPYLRPQACRSAGEAWTATTKTSNTACRHLQHNKRLCELALVPFYSAVGKWYICTYTLWLVKRQLDEV